MSTTTKKQIGDRVVITGGPRKGLQGNISALQGLKATIKLDDGTEVPAGVAWLDFVTIEQPETPVETATSEIETTPVEITVVPPVAEPVLEVATEMIISEPQLERVAVSEQTIVSAPDAPETAPVAIKRTRKRTSGSETGGDLLQKPLEKLTVAELQNLAKERDISVARTKADFQLILRELEPECDVESLKGSALYSKIAEHHISRLRSKQDLVVLLQS